ncbi:MAG: U32 family peptidase [Ruminococcus sp.]|nr:U32 family peptidase [Ruminococcus sp.]
MAEILAPCGSPEVLTAALRTGCDAVYLGGSKFSARQNAANFSDEELAEAVRECHIRGVKVYQAINTMLTDKELPACAEAVRLACKLGIDGLITQDLALAELVRECCPELEIHASTQMTLHTVSGFLLAKELGFSRAVASRELPERVIAELCALPTETEVFVHGALCMSVSGQCYMSAVIGSRSANRGLCAQACRLPASCVKGSERCGLSLRDMSYLPHLKKLERLGAASLKIEGRMKRPEYTAATVTAVRSELSGEDYDRSLLEGVFSRSGFTDGYYTSKTGAAMFGSRTKDDVEAAAKVLPALHALYRSEYKRSQVRAAVRMLRGEPLYVSFEDENGLRAEYTGELPQEAVNRPADSGYFEKQLSKLGDTVYSLAGVECEADEGLTVPTAELGRARRELCARLDELRYGHYTRRCAYEDRKFTFAPPNRNGRQELRITVTDPAQLRLADTGDIGLICGSMETVAALLGAGHPAEKLCAVMPRFTFNEKRDIARLRELVGRGITHIECTNYAHIYIGRELGLTMHGGFGLNAANSLALRVLRRLGLADCTASFELRASEISALGGELPYGIIGAGRLPMMLTVNCPIRAERGCKNCTGGIYDRTGRRFPVKCSKEQGYTEVLNAEYLSVSGRLGDFPGADFVMLTMYDESPERVRDILEAFRRNEKLSGEGMTSGLYYRGVK